MTNISSEVRRRGRRGRAVCMEGSCYCKPTTVKSRLFIEAPSGHQKWDFNAKLYFNPFNIFFVSCFCPRWRNFKVVRSQVIHHRRTETYQSHQRCRYRRFKMPKNTQIHSKLSTFPKTKIKTNKPLTSTEETKDKICDWNLVFCCVFSVFPHGFRLFEVPQ